MSKLQFPPDKSEKKLGKKWIDGKVLDVDYFLLDKSDTLQAVMELQKKNSNGSNFKRVAAGKCYTSIAVDPNILEPLQGLRQSGVNKDKVLVLDSSEARFEFDIQNMKQNTRFSKLFFDLLYLY